MVNWLKEIKHHTAPKVFGNDHEVQCVLDSVLSSGLCVQTTYRYQVIKNTPTREIVVIQYLCLPTLGICFWIKNYWVHCFLAGFFCHYTLVVIFIVDAKVFVGNHKGVQVFALGAGSVTNGPAVQPKGTENNDGQEGHADASDNVVVDEGTDEGREGNAYGLIGVQQPP